MDVTRLAVALPVARPKDHIGPSQRAEIRRWARENRLSCNDRGRIPDEVMAAWHRRAAS